MTTVLMMFILPLGLLLYFIDKKQHRENLELFDTYVNKILASDLESEAKLFKIDAMYYDNGYKIKRDGFHLNLCKKHFNIGLLFIYFGFVAYLGPILYAIYYHKFLKPECFEIEVL